MPYRRDFEMACLFNNTLPKAPGWLCKNQDGTYRSPEAELAYLAYAMRAEADKEQLKRFDPARTLVEGHMLQVNEALRKAGLVRPLTAEHIRIVLQVIGGSPV